MITLKKNDVICCLGDCLTYANNNGYPEYLQKYVNKHLPYLNLSFFNWGKENETIIDFSEKEYIESKSSPFLFNRLNTLLNNQQKPNYIIFCYGMYCGSFGSSSEILFCSFEDNLRKFLDYMLEKQIKVILLTPSPLIMDLVETSTGLVKDNYSKTNPYRYYNEEVLEEFRYTILYTTHEAIIDRVDIYTPLLENKSIAYHKDPVQPTERGQQIIAEEVLSSFYSTIN